MREKAANRDNYTITHGETLPHEVEYTLAQIIHKEIALAENVEKQMVKLLNCKDYNVQSAFKLIDKRHTRYIGPEELTNYLKNEKAGATEGDVEAFIRRLDKDLDYRVSYKEFADFFSAVDSKKKIKPMYLTTTKSFQSGTFRASSISRKSTLKTDRDSSMKKSKLFRSPTLTHSVISSKSSKSKLSAKRDSIRTSRTLTSTRKNLPRRHTVYTVMAQQLEAEKELEALRKNLSLYKDLTVDKLWDLITSSSKQYITIDDLMKELRGLGMAVEEELVFLLFSRFDADMDGQWAKEDVERVLFPVDEDYKQIIVKAISKNPESKIRKGTFKLLKRLLRTYMRAEEENEKAKASIEEVNEREAFDALDLEGRNFLGAEDVRVGVL